MPLLAHLIAEEVPLPPPVVITCVAGRKRQQHVRLIVAPRAHRVIIGILPPACVSLPQRPCAAMARVSQVRRLHHVQAIAGLLPPRLPHVLPVSIGIQQPNPANPQATRFALPASIGILPL